MHVAVHDRDAAGRLPITTCVVPRRARRLRRLGLEEPTRRTRKGRPQRVVGPDVARPDAFSGAPGALAFAAARRRCLLRPRIADAGQLAFDPIIATGFQRS